ncbi:MAG: hypothetical protein P4L92_23040 [Rudaea sp.]|nr:hypothetical protein [Rudaea sp.]
MFRFAPKGNVYWPVTVPTVDDAGTIGEATFLVLYRIFSRSELKARSAKLTKALVSKVGASGGGANIQSQEQLQKLVDETEAMQKQGESELLGRVLGWKDLTGDDGEPLPFSNANLKAVLDCESLYGPIERGLMEASRGAKAKN